jgi:hypothetical protein
MENMAGMESSDAPEMRCQVRQKDGRAHRSRSPSKNGHFWLDLIVYHRVHSQEALVNIDCFASAALSCPIGVHRGAHGNSRKFIPRACACRYRCKAEAPRDRPATATDAIRGDQRREVVCRGLWHIGLEQALR